jgi:hypothetical protein
MSWGMMSFQLTDSLAASAAAEAAALVMASATSSACCIAMSNDVIFFYSSFAGAKIAFFHGPTNSSQAVLTNNSARLGIQRLSTFLRAFTRDMVK